jgi:signal transduction histidine kinase
MADRLRLKQVILNLGRNSTKFVESGFIRLKAEEVDGRIKIFVEDSGSGIPMEKRERLFAKFQESLDLLSQGTVRVDFLIRWKRCDS